MVPISSRTSALRRPLPSRLRDFQVQYRRQPLRCHRIHGRRLDDQQVVAPGRPDLLEPHPQQAILVLEPEARLRSKGDLELMAENQVLESNVTVRPESSKETANEQREQLKHPAR